MKSRTLKLKKWLHMWTATAITVMLSGCVSIPTMSSTNKSVPASTPAAFTPKADVSKFGVDGKQLQGKYAGIYFCGNTPTKFVMDISSADGSHLSGKISRTDVKYQYNGKLLPSVTTESTFNSTYDDTSGAMQMRVEISTSAQQRLAHKHGLGLLRGVFMPDGSGFVALNYTPLSRNCTMWIAQRGDKFPSEWNYLDTEANPKVKTGFFSNYSLNRARRNDAGKKSCDEKLYNWIKQLDTAGKFGYELQTQATRNLYSDKYFVPHFGMPYHKIEFSDRQLYHVQFNGSCLRDPRLRQIANGNGVYAAESFYRPSRLTDIDKTISAIAFNMIHRWQALAMQHLDNMSKNHGNPDNVATLLTGGNTVMQILWPNERTQFKTYAEARQQEMIIPWLHNKLSEELARTPASMTDLEYLASFQSRSKQKYPATDAAALKPLNTQVAQKVNDTIQPVAVQYVQTLSSLADVGHIDGWQREFPHLASLLSGTNTNKLQSMLMQRRGEIALSLLAKEKQNYEQSVIQKGTTPAALQTGVGYENRFNQQYAIFASMPEYQSFAAVRRQARNKALEAAAPALIQMINKQEFERAINKVKKEYLLAEDSQSPAGRKILKAAEQRLVTVAPFRGDRISGYLNALYGYDYETLRQVDEASITPVKNAMESINPAMQGMGALMEFFSGGTIPARKIFNASMEQLGEASLIYPIMGYYVLNYEKLNPNCMEKNAKPHTIRYSWERTRTEHGYTYTIDSGESYTHYRVNPRFEHIFNRIYTTQGDKTLSKWADRFFQGSNKIYLDEVYDGTHNLMTQDCNTPTIKKLEKNMIRYFNEAMARQSNAVHKALNR